MQSERLKEANDGSKSGPKNRARCSAIRTGNRTRTSARWCETRGFAERGQHKTFTSPAMISTHSEHLFRSTPSRSAPSLIVALSRPCNVRGRGFANSPSLSPPFADGSLWQKQSSKKHTHRAVPGSTSGDTVGKWRSTTSGTSSKHFWLSFEVTAMSPPFPTVPFFLMRILLLNDDYPPRGLSSVGSVAEDLARGYRDRGHHVSVITTHRTEEDGP